MNNAALKEGVMSKFIGTRSSLRFMAAVFALGMAIGLVGCGKDSDGDKAPNQNLRDVKLQLPWVYQAQFAGPIVASSDGGEYAQKGFNVELREGGFDPTIVQRVAQGHVDFAVIQPDQLIYFNSQEENREKQLVSVAVIFKQSMTCFMVKKNSGISTFDDLRGKRIGVKENTNVDNEFNALLAQAGIDRKTDIDTVPVQWDLGVFIKGELDVFPGFSINEPYQVRKAGVEVEILTPSQFGLNLYGDVLATSRENAEDDPEFVKKFVAATLAGWRRAFSEPEEAVAAVLKRNELLEVEHQAFMLNACRNIAGAESEDFGLQDPAVWENMINILEKYGDLAPGKVQASTLFTNDFLP